MQLASFQLNLDHRDARRDLGNPYEMHRTIARLTEGNHNLWRLEGTRVLFISDVTPNWESVESQYFASEPSNKNFPIDKMKLSNRELRFRLLANPTKSIKEGQPRQTRGKRVPLIKEPDLRDWLSRQGERNGFQVIEVEMSQIQDLRFRKKRGHAEVVLGTCTFDGLLKVKDDQAFKTALKQGLGRGKAFGLGLLTVAPA